MLAICMALITEEYYKEKFERLYYTYKDMMIKVANSILHNTALADETVQDCLLKLAEIIKEVPDIPSKRAKALIVIMVKNKARNNLELEHYDDVVQLDDDDDFISDGLADNIATNLGYKRILQEIKELDVIYRDILILTFVHGFSAKEISEILQIPVRTVETRIYRGRKVLIEKLEDVYNEYDVKK
ncbi:MAG: RNA polymerase sigma factor [Oscillospiraceae bacterium]